MNRNSISLKLICVVVFSLVCLTSIFGQTTQRAIDLKKLSSSVYPVPSSFTGSSTSFNMLVDSTEQMTINLYSANQALQAKVVLKNNQAKKTVDYEIATPNSPVETVHISLAIENDKEVAIANTSSGRTLKIISSRITIDNVCTDNSLVNEIQIVEGNGPARVVSFSDLQLSIQKDDLQTVLRHTEEVFFDTPKLQLLHQVLISFDEFKRVVLANSTNELRQPEPGGTPNCNVACQRIGTVIPIYACNDDAFNCGRCGVDGVYILGGFGCFWFCSIPCGVFYV